MMAVISFIKIRINDLINHSDAFEMKTFLYIINLIINQLI